MTNSLAQLHILFPLPLGEHGRPKLRDTTSMEPAVLSHRKKSTDLHFRERFNQSEFFKSLSNSKRENRTLVLLQRHDVEIMFLVFVIEWSRTIKMAGLLFAPGRTLTSWSTPIQVMQRIMGTMVLLCGMTGLVLN